MSEQALEDMWFDQELRTERDLEWFDDVWYHNNGEGPYLEDEEAWAIEEGQDCF